MIKTIKPNTLPFPQFINMHNNLEMLKSKIDNNDLLNSLNKLLDGNYFKTNINGFKFPENSNDWVVVITLYFTGTNIPESVIYIKDVVKETLDNLDDLNIEKIIKDFNKEIIKFVKNPNTKETQTDSLFRPLWGFRDCIELINNK